MTLLAVLTGFASLDDEGNHKLVWNKMTETDARRLDGETVIIRHQTDKTQEELEEWESAINRVYNIPFRKIDVEVKFKLEKGGSSEGDWDTSMKILLMDPEQGCFLGSYAPEVCAHLEKSGLKAPHIFVPATITEAPIPDHMKELRFPDGTVLKASADRKHYVVS